VIRFILGVLTGVAAAWSALAIWKQLPDAIVETEVRDYDRATGMLYQNWDVDPEKVWGGHPDDINPEDVPPTSASRSTTNEDRIENGWPTYDR
jgi:hypothetical protein